MKNTAAPICFSASVAELSVSNSIAYRSIYVRNLFTFQLIKVQLNETANISVHYERQSSFALIAAFLRTLLLSDVAGQRRAQRSRWESRLLHEPVRGVGRARLAGESKTAADGDVTDISPRLRARPLPKRHPHALKSAKAAYGPSRERALECFTHVQCPQGTPSSTYIGS